MKLTTMLPFAWAAAAAAAALSSRDDGANKTIAIKDITLTFCTQWGANSSCQTANLHHGHCCKSFPCSCYCCCRRRRRGPPPKLVLVPCLARPP